MPLPRIARPLRFALVVLAVVAAAGSSRADGSSSAADSTKKTDDIGHVDGIEIARPSGGYLGLEIVDNRFVLSFYDAKKHKVAPDVALATTRWSVHYQPNDERITLLPGADGTSLTSPRIVRPPHIFKLYLGLFNKGSDDAVEFHVIDVHE